MTSIFLIFLSGFLDITLANNANNVGFISVKIYLDGFEEEIKFEAVNQIHVCLLQKFELGMNFSPPIKEKKMKCSLADTEYDYWVQGLLENNQCFHILPG